MSLVLLHGYQRVAFPILGSGSGGYPEDDALALMLDELATLPGTCAVTIVRFDR